MASYLPNGQDFIPQIQPYRPDFNFYAGALQMKQGQYDQAHKQISQMYGSLLNAPMMREGNLEARNDYFKTIEGEIKKISNLDLSKQANVDSAVNLFSGLYENQNIVKDMMWTKSYQQQVKRGEGFRNCVDPAKCGGAFWQGGLDALEYKAQEFRAATDEQALGFGNVNYTPYQNVMEKAIKLAKDAELNITVDQVQGRYIVTTKNGPMLMDPLNSLFTGALANDPGIMEYYKTKAYVDRKGWVNSNIPVYGSQEAAEMAYIEQVSGGLNSMLTGAKKEVDSTVETIQGQKRILEERIRTEGANPNGTLAEQYRALNNLEGQTLSSQESINAADKTYKNSIDPAMRNFMGENLDNAMASYLLAGDIGAAAETLAFKNYEQTLKEDPYAMESVRQSNRLMLENTRHQNALLEEQFKFDLEHFKEMKAARGTVDENIPTISTDAVGATTANLSETAVFDVYQKDRKEDIIDLSRGEKSIMSQFMSQTQQASKNENGQGMASADLIKFGDILFNEIVNTKAEFYNENTGEYASNAIVAKDRKDAYANWNKKTDAQKIEYAQSQDFDRIINRSGISGTVLDNLYEQLVLPSMNMNADSIKVNKDYLSDMWVSTKAERDNIAAKNIIVEKTGQWHAQETQNIIAAMESKAEYAPYADIMRMYKTETGATRSSTEFATAFAQKLSNEGGLDYNAAYEQGLNLYRGDIGVEKAIKNTAFGVPFLTISGKPDDTLDQIWGQAFSALARPKGGNIALGLLGTDSYATTRLSFNNVDPVSYQSDATMHTTSFMKDALGASTDNVMYAVGSPTAALPEESNAGMQTFLSQLYKDFVTNKDPKDETRPILSTSFQRIAGGSDEWSALHIKMPYEYMKDFVGTEANPGPLFGDLSSLENGFTVYLNDAVATNGFYEATKTSDVEQMMLLTGKYDFDSYPQYTGPEGIQLKMNAQGNYVLKGSAIFLNEEGAPIMVPMTSMFTSLGTDPTLAVQQINETLSEIAYKNQQIEAYYNSLNGIKDPEMLLNP